MHCLKTAFLSNKIQYICISLLLWTMHINTISDFIRSTHLIISWFIMIYRDISWYFLIFLDKSWYITMYHDLSWFITIYHDISWFTAVLGEVNDKCHCHANFCPIKHLILIGYILDKQIRPQGNDLWCSALKHSDSCADANLAR